MATRLIAFQRYKPAPVAFIRQSMKCLSYSLTEPSPSVATATLAEHQRTAGRCSSRIALILDLRPSETLQIAVKHECGQKTLQCALSEAYPCKWLLPHYQLRRFSKRPIATRLNVLMVWHHPKSWR